MTRIVKFHWPKGLKPIYVPIYGSVFYFVDSRELFDHVYAYMSLDASNQEQMPEYVGGAVMPLTNAEGGRSYIIGVFDGTYGVLCHEVGHLALFILAAAGVPVDEHNSEAFCYLQGWLFEVIQPLLDASNLRAAEAEVAEAKAAEAAAAAAAPKPPESSPKPAKSKGVRRGRS